MSYIKNISLIIILLILPACSAYKAASNEGVSVPDVIKCKAKGCFLSLGMDIVSNKLNNNTQFVETYRGKARKSGGSCFRAFGHGALDVVTFGLWEVAATPIEGALSNNLGYVTAIVTYQGDNDSSDITDLEIYDASGKKITLKAKKTFVRD